MSGCKFSYNPGTRYRVFVQKGGSCQPWLDTLSAGRSPVVSTVRSLVVSLLNGASVIIEGDDGSELVIRADYESLPALDLPPSLAPVLRSVRADMGGGATVGDGLVWLSNLIGHNKMTWIYDLPPDEVRRLLLDLSDRYGQGLELRTVLEAMGAYVAKE